MKKSLNKSNYYSRLLIYILLSLLIFGVVIISVYSPSKVSSESNLLIEHNVDDSKITKNEDNDPYWENRLYTPTMFIELNGIWFIVDCWHHRVLWSYDPSIPIKNWGVVDSKLAGPHSIAYDGHYFGVDDTGNNALVFYEFIAGKFKRVNYIENVGIRPHRIVYDNQKKAFYVVTAGSQEMFKIEYSDSESFEITKRWSLEHINNEYIRTFTIVDNFIYFTSPGEIIKTSNDDTFKVISRYKMIEGFEDLNDIYHTGDKFIITAKDAIGVIQSMDDVNEIVNLKEEMGIKGFPYYVSQYDDLSISIPEIRPSSAIKIYTTKDLLYKQTINESGPPSESSLERSKEYNM